MTVAVLLSLRGRAEEVTSTVYEEQERIQGHNGFQLEFLYVMINYLS